MRSHYNHESLQAIASLYIEAGIFVTSNFSYLYLSYVMSPIHTLSRVIHLHLFVKLYEDTESKFS